MDTISNRQLLLETCVTCDLVVANTWHDHPNDMKITCRNVGTEPMDTDITASKFSQIDHVLCHRSILSSVTDCWSDRTESLNSRHCLTIAKTHIEFDTQGKACKHQLDLKALSNQGIQRKFIAEFVDASMRTPSTDILETAAENLKKAFAQASACLPAVSTTAKQPWTSSSTLDLIEERSTYRQSGDYANEKRLNKEIRKSGKQDREKWWI